MAVDNRPSEYVGIASVACEVEDRAGEGGDRILPALYSDNYVSLMPGERRTIITELEGADTRGESPRIVVEGFNVDQSAAK